MSEICSENECNREVFENRKCILHCEKDDWYVNENGKKDWSKSDEKIKEFWREIRSIISITKINLIIFKNIKFPLFEQFTTDDLLEHKAGENISYQWKKDKCFWKSGSFLEFRKDINFHNCIFYDNILFKCTEFNSVLFVESTLMGSFISTDSKFFRLLKFDNTIIKGSVNFKATELTEIVIEKCKEIHKISFNRSTISAFIIIQGKSIINDLKFELCRFKVLKINDCSINKLELMKYSSCLDYMQFEDFKIRKLILNDFDVYNCKTIYLNNCTTDDFIINNLIGQAKFTTLSKLIINKLLKIENSNCSNFKFHNFIISNAKKTFNNISFISNKGFTIFNGVKWGDIRKTFDKTTDRDTFRQLKYVNEKQGNIIEANKFYSAEMEAYKKELKGEKWKTHWQDKIIFWLNKKSSNFSQNWLKPLGWFFLIGFIAFVFSNLCKIISYLNDTSKITLTTLWNAIKQFFKYLNPFNTSAGEWNPVIWLVFKALSIFIIYQFIISLRRQTRR